MPPENRSRLMNHPLVAKGVAALRRKPGRQAKKPTEFKVTADFEGGNVDGVAILAPNHIRITARPDLSPKPLWFYFCLENAPGSSVRIDLANADECLGSRAGWLNARPVFSGDGVHWQRVARTNYVGDPNERGYFTFTVPVVGSRTQVAYCYPYGPSQLQALLEELDSRGCPEFRHRIICETSEGRPIPMVTIGPPTKAQASVWLLGRQHAGETPPSFVLAGLLRWLAGDDETAVQARQRWAFHCLPMLDVDGAFRGRFGKDEAPLDMNRDWQDEPRRLETTAGITAIHESWRETPYDLLIDLHASHHGDTRCYFFGLRSTQSEVLYRRQSRFLAHLAEAAPAATGFKATDLRDREPPEHSLREWAWRRHGGLAMCLELSYHLSQSGRHLSVKDYEEFGQALGRALVATLEE